MFTFTYLLKIVFVTAMCLVPLKADEEWGPGDCCLWLDIPEQEGHALSNTYTHAIRFANDLTFAQ